MLISNEKNKVTLACDNCTKTVQIALKGYKRSIKLKKHTFGQYLCASCVGKNWWHNRPDTDKQESITKLSESIKQKWQDPEYLAKQSVARTDELKSQIGISVSKSFEARRHNHIKGLIARHQSGVYNKHLAKINNDPDIAARRLVSSKLYNQTDAAKKSHSDISKKLWADDTFRAKVLAKLANLPKVSKLQESFYSILDDLNIHYYREWNDKPDDAECIIGPYSFDCVIPRDGKTTLLVEINGTYIHSRPRTIAKDQSKSSYVSNNLSNTHELKVIWEHEFNNPGKVVELVKYWTGCAAFNKHDFDFKSVTIKPCEDKRLAKQLLDKYHYLGGGRGGLFYGAYLNNELIATIVYSPLLRQNMENSLGHKAVNVKELSRLCIHPAYQKKNFASWLVSKSIKQLPPSIKLVVSYCDKTFNHTGSVYKACGFTQDIVVPPDYWYVDDAGWVMHKRTLYGHAIRSDMTELEYATIHNYNKVVGMGKLRFIKSR